MDVSTLRAQHVEIERLARDLLSAVGGEERRSVAALRWRLARALMSHLAIEDRFLYPALITGPDKAVADTARRFQSEMGDLAGRFSSYIARWSDHEVIAHWPDFCRETRQILDALLIRVMRENAELYVLAGRDGYPPRRLTG